MNYILKTSFWQLLIIYSLIVLAVALGFFSKYSIQFNLFAIILGVIGAFSLKEEKSKKLNKKIHYFLLLLGIILIFTIRVIPYFFTDIPLGYDAGLYKYGIEKGLQNKDKWILEGGMEPGFLYLMQPFKLFFSTDFILKYLFVFFCALLGFSIYLVGREYFNEKAGLISLFIFAFSLIQFKTFWFLYYKNIIGLSLMLFSIYFLKRSQKTKTKLNKILFIIFGGLTGAIHRPTFFIFGLSYFFYAFISPYENKKYNKSILTENIISGIFILIVFFAFYLGDFLPAIVAILPWVANGFVDPGSSPGTFVNFFTYQYSILPYFIFSIFGFLACLKKKLGILEIWAIINFLLVYFRFFFFNRFIIMLDIALLLFASYGFYILITQKNKLGRLVFIILFFSLIVFCLKEALETRPLLEKDELEAIQSLSLTDEASFVMSTSSYYSPWIIGYSERKTIAPGLFDYNLHSKEEWAKFLKTKDLEEIKSFLKLYNKPLFIFVGKRQEDFIQKFNETNCFKLFKEKNKNKIYQYLC